MSGPLPKEAPVLPLQGLIQGGNEFPQIGGRGPLQVQDHPAKIPLGAQVEDGTQDLLDLPLSGRVPAAYQHQAAPAVLREGGGLELTAGADLKGHMGQGQSGAPGLGQLLGRCEEIVYHGKTPLSDVASLAVYDKGRRGRR